jgi:prepilin-type N-terminal cleavage/methylation domain-containing protein
MSPTDVPGGRRDGGFTLIELLIVILILGILAAIAIFTLRPFERRALEVCFDLELATLDVVDAAQRAGIDVSMNDDTQCIPVALEFAQAMENPNSVITLTEQPQPGRTMIAVSGHRSTASPPGPNPVICSGSEYAADGTCLATTDGWVLHGFFNVGSGSSGRGIAVWTKVAGPDEPTVVRANWVSPNWGGSKSLVVGVFNRELTVTGIAGANSGTGSQVTSLALGSASGGDGPAIVVGAVATRASSGGGGPCSSANSNCLTYSGVDGLKKAAEQGSSVYTGMAWAVVRDGATPNSVVASWEVPRHAVGFTLVLSVFP